MTIFQEKILKRFKEITSDDFTYFTKESEKKIIKMGLPKRCSIEERFEDCLHRKYLQRQYCLKNCGLRCLVKKKSVPSESID